MKIKCWGARGSIPVSGREYIRYGGDTTCMEIRSDDDRIVIVDAGSGIRRLGNSLLDEGRYAYSMIFTHAHWDHLLGFPFFKPIYRKGTHIEMFGCPFAQRSIMDIVAKSMQAPSFPVDFTSIQAEMSHHEVCEERFSIGSINVDPILLSHPNQGIGYQFVENGARFVFLTDNELTYKHPGGRDYEDYLEFVRGADLLIHDAEFTTQEYEKTKTWGHTTYRDALRLAMEGEVKSLGLFHHNQDRADTGVDEIVDDCQRIIEEQGSDLTCFAAHTGMELTL